MSHVKLQAMPGMHLLALNTPAPCSLFACCLQGEATAPAGTMMPSVLAPVAELPGPVGRRLQQVGTSCQLLLEAVVFGLVCQVLDGACGQPKCWIGLPLPWPSFSAELEVQPNAPAPAACAPPLPGALQADQPFGSGAGVLAPEAAFSPFTEGGTPASNP